MATLTSFNHQTGTHLDIDGARLYVERAGDLGKPPLVLLHGGFGNIEDFNGLLPTLAKDFHLIGIDSRGHGASTLGGDALSYQRLERDVLQALAHLDISRASILGFSDGGITACRIAASGKLELDKLAVVGTPWRLEEASKALYAKVTPDSWKQKFPGTFEAYQRLNPEPDFARFAQATIQMWQDPSPSGHPEESIGQIRAPVLIVRGDDDHLVSLDSAVEFKRRVKGARFMNLPFAGHVAFDDQKDAFLAGVNQFFSQG
ncbi:MAG: alpha/beta hydrolase [Rubrivivax sp.]|nr:MAG: alpha/beta hydrolase [Rubrivivax sp.]